VAEQKQCNGRCGGKHIINVPHLSQILDVKDSDWHNRACGVVSLAMVMKYFLNLDAPTTDELIKEGLSIGAYNEKVGWIHGRLVLLAHNYSLYAYQEEFKSSHLEFEEGLCRGALEKFKNSILNNNPIIVSVEPNFRNNKVSHLIVLIGVEFEENNIKGFYLHDPQSKKRGDGEAEFVSLERFMEYWRKTAIFVSKKTL
jgi:hypothetical protein